MGCDRDRMLLDALADGELRWWAKQQIRRHLARCQECASEYEAVERLGARVASLPAPPMPTGVRERLAQLLTEEAEMSCPDTRHRRTPGLRPWATRMAAAVASLAVLLVGLALLFLPGRSTTAFAEVAKEMRRVPSASWHLEAVGYGEDGKTLTHRSTTDVWYRADPAAYAEHCTYFWFANNRDNSRDQWTMYSASGARIAELGKYTWRTWNYFEPQSWESDLGPDDLMAKVLAPPHTAAQEAALHRGAPFEFTPWGAGLDRIDGQIAAKFRRTAQWTFTITDATRGSAAQPKVHRQEIGETLWADPKTHLVVKRELSQLDLRTHKIVYRLVCSRFRYSEAAPDLAFRWPRARGAQVTVESKRRHAGVWGTLPKEDRGRVLEVVRGADAAWLSGDLDRWSAQWDFVYLQSASRQGPAEAARRAEWRSRMVDARGKWSHWHTDVRGADAQDYAYSDRFGAMYVPAADPELLAVRGLTRAVTRSGQRLEGRCAIYMRKTGEGGYRVVEYVPPSLHPTAGAPATRPS